MNLWDVILGIGLIALVAWAAVKSIRRRKSGSCCGDCAGCVESEAAEKKIRIRDINKAHYPYDVTLKIEGMTCENCARRVENALNALDGIWAKVDIGSHLAKIRSKEQPDKTMLVRAIVEAGYSVAD